MAHICGYRPIAIYNAKKKELIGIFRYKVSVARYIYKNYNCDKSHYVEYCLKRNGRIIKDLVFDFKVALRYANELQIDMLGNREYIILNGYYSPTETRMEGFNYSTSNITNKTKNNGNETNSNGRAIT
jgi:hypothetical protein